MISGFERAARARLRNFEASRRWIPNRHDYPLHEAERMAEDSGERLREAAKATGNKSLLACLDALRAHASEKQRKAPPK